MDGRPLAALGPGRELAGLVGVMHQQFDLVPHLAVVHNVLAGRLGQWGLVPSLLSLLWPRERRLAEEALDRLGIADKLLERTSRLSGGEQQRVAIARLMVQSSQVILADEPVSSLDPARAEDMLELLTGLAAAPDKALVASLHSPALIRRYFTRVIGLRDGLLQFDLPAGDLDDDSFERLYELGAHRPACRILRTTSSGIESDLYSRTVRRDLMHWKTSIVSAPRNHAQHGCRNGDQPLHFREASSARATKPT